MGRCSAAEKIVVMMEATEITAYPYCNGLLLEDKPHNFRETQSIIWIHMVGIIYIHISSLYPHKMVIFLLKCLCSSANHQGWLVQPRPERPSAAAMSESLGPLFTVEGAVVDARGRLKNLAYATWKNGISLGCAVCVYIYNMYVYTYIYIYIHKWRERETERERKREREKKINK